MGSLFANTVLPRWAVMWGLALSIFAALKLLTWSQRKQQSAPLWRHAAYLFGWPGMDVDAFLGGRPVKCPSIGDWVFALVKAGCSVGVLLLAVPKLAGRSEYLIGWVGMLGIVGALHFGLFDVLSCLWRSLGACAVPIMNWPILSQGLAEFWGKRWNLAFRDLTHRFLFRPLVGRVSAVAALMIGFLLSGLVHDLVISVPAEGGFGLPTCYFVIQGIAILVERSRLGRFMGLGRGARGWLFCAAVVLLPCPLLFHTPFLREAMVPFLQAVGIIQ